MGVRKLKIGLREGRRMALRAQGLWGNVPFAKGKKGTLEIVQQLGYIQIDTISVIRRTHHHTLWVRQPGYHPEQLHELQSKDRQVFEYWSHAAAYLPMRDYRYSLPRKERIAGGEKHWFDRDTRVMDYVLDRIRAEGPLQARDFDAPPGFDGKGMWVLKPAKIALEQLFMEGKLMVRERRGFQKVFDLPERVLPGWVDTSSPTLEEWGRHLVLQGLQAMGLATLEELCYLRTKAKPVLSSVLQAMVHAGEVLMTELEGNEGITWYLLPDTLEQLPVRAGRRRVHLLSPFDNTVIQRKRLNRLFAFDYQLECYVPAAKRIYGYFCLPILWGDQFVGRLDPKAERKDRILLVKNLDLQIRPTEAGALLPTLAAKLQQLAAFNDCDAIRIEHSNRPEWKIQLTQILNL